VIRGERPIKHRNSWFYVKNIEVLRNMNKKGVEHWMNIGWPNSFTEFNQSPNTFVFNDGKAMLQSDYG